MTSTYTMNTSNIFTLLERRIAWSYMIMAVVDRCDRYQLTLDKLASQSTVSEFIQQSCDRGTLVTARKISGRITPQFIGWLLNPPKREEILSMVVFSDDTPIIEHYDRGDIFTVKMDWKEFAPVAQELTKHGIDEGIANWTSCPSA